MKNQIVFVQSWKGLLVAFVQHKNAFYAIASYNNGTDFIHVAYYIMHGIGTTW